MVSARGLGYITSTIPNLNGPDMPRTVQRGMRGMSRSIGIPILDASSRLKPVEVVVTMEVFPTQTQLRKEMRMMTMMWMITPVVNGKTVCGMQWPMRWTAECSECSCLIPEADEIKNGGEYVMNV